ncbi:MAG TPA: NIPSNAP family protein [Chloroflexota bacterium]|jgi:hypothetical protein
MLYEYRTYQAVPGKLPALNKRFAELTTKVWERHGIRVVGFFEAVVGASNELHYILQWADMADRERKWEAFQKDPEWQQGRAQTEGDGPLVVRVTNSFWRPTPYSPMQ